MPSVTNQTFKKCKNWGLIKNITMDCWGIIEVDKIFQKLNISKAFFLFTWAKKHKNLILSVKMLCSTYYCYWITNLKVFKNNVACFDIEFSKLDLCFSCQILATLECP